MCTKKFLVVAVIAVLFAACKKEKESVQPVREVIHKSFVGDNISGKEVFPAKGLYGENILSEDVTVVKRGHTYSVCANLPKYDINTFDGNAREATEVKIKIKTSYEEDVYCLYTEDTKLIVNWTKGWSGNKDTEYHQNFSALWMEYNDMLAQVFAKDYITIEYYVEKLTSDNKLIILTKVRTLKVVD